MNNDPTRISGGVVSICDPNEVTVTWKEIPGFSKYQASNLGLIRNKKKDKVSTLYKVSTSKGSYFNVSAVADDRGDRSKQVHHLICRAFHGDPPTSKHEVNHKDGNKHHNCPHNLEWMTRSENLTHAYETGLRSDNIPIVVTDVRSGETERFASLASLARFLKMTPGTISSTILDHREVPFRKIYTFEKDYSDHQVTGWDWVRDIVAYDYVDRTSTVTSDSGQMEWLTGVKRQTIMWRLRRATDRDVMVNGYVFRYRDEFDTFDDFPTHSSKDAQESRDAYAHKPPPRSKRYGVRVKNYIDGLIADYGTLQAAGDATNVSKGTIRYLLNQPSKRLFRGYGFQYLDDATEFPEYDRERIELSLIKKKPEYPSVRVKDFKTNTTKYYPSLKELASEVGVTASALATHMRKKPNSPYRDRYSLELVY